MVDKTEYNTDIEDKKILCKATIFKLPEDLIPSSQDEYFQRYPHAARRALDFAYGYYAGAKSDCDLPNMIKYANRILYLQSILGFRRNERRKFPELTGIFQPYPSYKE